LALPSGVEALFDGLPLSRKPEVWVAAAILPFLLILGRKFLRLKAAAWILAALAALKLGLFLLCPASGWEMRVYASPQAKEQGAWEQTYASILRPGVSQILDKPLSKGREFPIEWMNRLQDRNNLWLGVELTGFMRLPQNAGLALMASGCRAAKAWVTDRHGHKRKIPLVPDMAAAATLIPEILPQGRGKVSVYLEYQKGNWTLLPIMLLPGKIVRPVFKQGILWRSPSCLHTPDWSLSLMGLLSQVMDYGFLGWLGAWCLWCAAALWRSKILNIPIMILSLAAVILPRLMHLWVSSPDKLAPLAWGVFGAGGLLAGLLIWRRRDWPSGDGSLAQAVLLVLGPGVLSYFLELWSGQLASMSFYSLGDDWLTYQNFAREIFVNGDWAHLSRPVFHLQPLYRYMVGILHLVFGQSPLAQNLLDVWAMLGAGALIAAVGCKMKLSPMVLALGVWLYFSVELGTNLHTHLGRGLQEHVAMLFMMLTAWAAAKSALKIARPAWKSLAGAGLLAALAYWLRQDHLGVLAGLGLLALPHSRGAAVSAWRELVAGAYNWRRSLLGFWAVLAMAVLAVALRNWAVGGHFTLTAPGNLAFLTGLSLGDILGNFRVLLLASQSFWQWPALVLVPGALAGIAALVVRPAFLQEYPLALGICLAGLLAPCLVVRLTAYIPRWSIHLLPLAVLSLCYVAQGLIPGLNPKRSNPGEVIHAQA
jgi:hypothetical protein